MTFILQLFSRKDCRKLFQIRKNHFLFSLCRINGLLLVVLQVQLVILQFWIILKKAFEKELELSSSLRQGVIHQLDPKVSNRQVITSTQKFLHFSEDLLDSLLSSQGLEITINYTKENFVSPSFELPFFKFHQKVVIHIIRLR